MIPTDPTSHRRPLGDDGQSTRLTSSWGWGADSTLLRFRKDVDAAEPQVHMPTGYSSLGGLLFG